MASTPSFGLGCLFLRMRFTPAGLGEISFVLFSGKIAFSLFSGSCKSVNAWCRVWGLLARRVRGKKRECAATALAAARTRAGGQASGTRRAFQKDWVSSGGAQLREALAFKAHSL